MKTHSLLSPSGAHRWLNCTPSAVLEREHGGESPSRFADEGTLAHELAEKHLTGALLSLPSEDAERLEEDAEKYGTTPYEILQILKPYTEYCEELIAKSEWFQIEKKISLPFIAPDTSGTADFCAIVDGILYVVDLKYGMGVPVSADGNPQLALYGEGVRQALYKNLKDKIREVVFVIIQPRLDRISEARNTVEELSEWVKNVAIPSAEKALIGAGEQKAGEHCQFCKIKGKCRAFKDFNSALIKRSTELDPRLLSPQELADILEETENWDKLTKAVALEVSAQLHAGKEIPGYMLVKSQGNRAWKDEEEVKSYLELCFPPEVVFETKLLSVAKLEKKLGKKEFSEFSENFVHRPDNGSKVVKFDPKKQQFNPKSQILDDFETF
jgi:hypothetical protein